MSSNRADWEEADFTPIAAFMRPSGEALVQTLGVTPAMRVLDLGCGDGTTALPLARLGAEVVGIDIARNLVAAGQRRAAQEGLTRLEICEGDACRLEGVRDHAFDLTVSLFGALFAPRPFEVAREMVRVTKPGGRIVMGNWMPDEPSFISQLRKVSAALLPPAPEGASSTLDWGVEAHVLERFGRAGVPPERISLVRDTYTFASPDRTPEELVDAFVRFYEPTFRSAGVAERLGAFRSRLLGLARAQNRSARGQTCIPANYLRVTVSL